MRAAIRWLGNLDIDDLETWYPEGESWVLGLRILAGPDDGPGEESFDVTICSPAWLSQRVRREGVVDGRHHLVVERFDWPSLRSYIERYVAQCEAGTWREIAGKLARLGHWEFEDYRSAT